MRSSVGLSLLYFAFLARFFLGNYDIGPLSPSAYIVPILCLSVGAHCVASRFPLFRTKEAWHLFIVYFSYIVWMSVNRAYNGEEISHIFYSTASGHFFSLGSFVVTQYLVTRKKDAINFAGVMAVAVVVSGLIGIAQWLGVSWAWNLAFITHPSAQVQETYRLIIESNDRVVGLLGSASAFMYLLVSFGFFTYSWLNKEQGVKAIIGAIGVGIVSLALLVGQFRSVLIVVGLAPAILFWISANKSRRGEGVSYGQVPISRLIFFSLVFLFIMIVAYKGSEPRNGLEAGQGEYRLNRMYRLEDDTRMDLLRVAINVSKKNLLMGAGMEEFGKQFSIYSDNILDRYGYLTRPHSYFINALVFYGLPGVIFSIMLLWISFRICRKAIQMTDEQSSMQWICSGAVLGFLANSIVAMFHNNGVGSGESTALWLLGLLCALISLAEEKRADALAYHPRGAINVRSVNQKKYSAL